MADFPIEMQYKDDGTGVFRTGYVDYGSVAFTVAPGDTVTFPFARHGSEEGGLGIIVEGTDWDFDVNVLYERTGGAPILIPLNVGGKTNFTGDQKIGVRVEPSTPAVRVVVNAVDSGGNFQAVWSVVRGLR